MTGLEASTEIKKSQEVLPARAAIQTPIQNNPPREIQKTKEQWIEEGNRLRDCKQFSESLAAFEQVIRLDPNYAAAYNNKGYALNKLERYEEGLEAFEQALHLIP